MPVLAPLVAIADGTPDGTGSTSTTRQVHATSAPLADGETYLVLWDTGALVDGGSGDPCEVDIQLGSTELGIGTGRFAGGFDPPGPYANSAAVASGMTVVTGNGVDAITVGSRRLVAGATGVLFSGGGAIAIPIGGLTEGTHYWTQIDDSAAWSYQTPGAGTDDGAGSFTFTPVTTGPHLLVFSMEGGLATGAGAATIRSGRFTLVTDPTGSPTELVLGAGNNGGVLDPAFHQYAPAATPGDIIGGYLYPQVVSLTAGTEYELRFDAIATDANATYRRFRFAVLDAAPWVDGFRQVAQMTGLQPQAANPDEVFITDTLPAPATEQDEYVVISGTTAMNNNAWWHSYHEYDGVRRPDPGGFSNGGFVNGTTLTSDYFWVTGLDLLTVTASTVVDTMIATEFGDCPFGFAHAQGGGGPTDPSIMSRLISWRMETTAGPSGAVQGAAVGDGSSEGIAAATAMVLGRPVGEGSSLGIAAVTIVAHGAAAGSGSTTSIAVTGQGTTVQGAAAGSGSTSCLAAGRVAVRGAAGGVGASVAIALPRAVVRGATAGEGETTAIAAGTDAREYDAAAAAGEGSTLGVALPVIRVAMAAHGSGSTTSIATHSWDGDLSSPLVTAVYTGRRRQGIKVKVR